MSTCKDEQVDVRELWKMFSLCETLKTHVFRVTDSNQYSMWKDTYGICKTCGAFVKNVNGEIIAVHDPMHWSTETIHNRFHNLTKHERAIAIAIARWLL